MNFIVKLALITKMTEQRALMLSTILSLCLCFSVSASASKSIDMPTSECPEQFNSIKLPVDGKLCQVFAADYPASMVIHIPNSPEEVISQYLANHPSLKRKNSTHTRTMLQSDDKNTTLIVSPDGSGTQMDILVKSPNKN